MKNQKHLLGLLCMLLFSFSAAAQSALNFDGVDDYVSVQKAPTLQSTDAMTIEAWIQADAWQSLIYKGSVISNSNNQGGDNGFDLRAGADGKAEINIAINGTWATATSESVMQTGTWHHVAGVYDGSQVKIFIDGIERNASSATGTISTFQKNLYFGECPGWSGRTFDGKIDEIRYWNTARTEQEIQENINQSLNGTETGLIGYWKLDEGNGNTTSDQTSNNHLGTLTNMEVPACWVDNYICPFQEPDVAPTAIISPISGYALTNQETVEVTITNFSLTPATNIPISYSINGGTAITETLTATIPALGSVNFTFTETANLLDEGDYIFEITTMLAGDTHPENDIYSGTVTHFSNTSNFALDFDGTNDYVAIANDPALNPGNALTIEAWINANEWKPTAWGGTIVGKDGDANSDTQTGYVLRAGKEGTLEFVCTPGWNAVASAPLMESQKWYHVAGVFDGSEMRLYINGVLQASKSHTSPIVSSDFDLLIGECPGFGGRAWKGLIDEVRIWNLARSQQELMEHMTHELQGTEAGLVAYYQFNDGIGSPNLTDATANGFDGTLTNMDPDTDWVTGFELIQNDAGIIGIKSPVSGPEWTNSERVKVNIKNFGFNEISNFDVSYTINGGDVVTETVTNTIQAFSSITYSFKKRENLSELSNCEIHAFTSLENDADPSNDDSQTTISKSNTIVLYQQEQHNFGAEGQWHVKDIFLPESNTNYERMLLHINLECPETGCDPWDQPAFVKVKKGGHQYEIARYITPFGVACGEWTVDVTDFRSILCGEIELTSYIQVWGPSGWLVTLELEYIEGTPDFPYSKVDPLWEKDYWVYGDPGISYDLPEQTLSVANNAEAVHVRMTTTGHGQGNTDNAAEFSHKIHDLLVNGTPEFEHDLWKEDCNQNPCSPQNGTWQYARSGWCPGQAVIPLWWNLEGLYTPGNDITLDYELETYTNLLNTGYNGGSHTEPHYRINSYLVSQSSSPLSPITDVGISAITSPVTNETLSTNEPVTVQITNYGTEAVTHFEVSYYFNNHAVVTETVDQTIDPGQTLEYTFDQTADLSSIATYYFVAVSTLSTDENAGNDFSSAIVAHGNIGFEYLDTDLSLQVVPNPSNGQFKLNIQGYEGHSQLLLTDTRGTICYQRTFVLNQPEGTLQMDFTNLPKGFYFLKIKTDHGIRIEKILIQ